MPILGCVEKRRISVHDPLSKTAMFLDQNEVNQFIDNYSGAKSEEHASGGI